MDEMIEATRRPAEDEAGPTLGPSLCPTPLLAPVCDLFDRALTPDQSGNIGDGGDQQ